MSEVSRLQNSLSHLRKTQEELIGFIRDNPDGDDDGELGKAVEENDQVMFVRPLSAFRFETLEVICYLIHRIELVRQNVSP